MTLAFGSCTGVRVLTPGRRTTRGGIDSPRHRTRTRYGASGTAQAVRRKRYGARRLTADCGPAGAVPVPDRRETGGTGAVPRSEPPSATIGSDDRRPAPGRPARVRPPAPLAPLLLGAGAQHAVPGGVRRRRAAAAAAARRGVPRGGRRDVLLV